MTWTLIWQVHVVELKLQTIAGQAWYSSFLMFFVLVQPPMDNRILFINFWC